MPLPIAPLALSLAAAGLKLYGPHAELVEFIRHPLDLLAGHTSATALEKAAEQMREWARGSDVPANGELEQALARSALMADLFCLTDALPAGLDERPTLHERWSVFRTLLAGPASLFQQADEAMIRPALNRTRERLDALEKGHFTPTGINAFSLVGPIAAVEASKMTRAALSSVEAEFGPMPDAVHRAFTEHWFGYLCLAFHDRLKSEPRVAVIFSTMQTAIGFDHLERVVHDEGALTRKQAHRHHQDVTRKLDEIAERLQPAEEITVVEVIPTTPALLLPAPANPFQPLRGRVDNTRFFDRTQELARIFEVLNSGASVALLGARGIGKSSLLSAVGLHVEAKLNEPRRPLYLDLQQISGDKDFFEALCELMDVPVAKGFRLSRSLRGKKFLLVLDEVEKMTWKGFTHDVRSQLRGLAEGPEAPLRLILAASKSLDTVFDDRDVAHPVSPLANICLEVQLGPWTLPVVQEFIDVSLAGTGVTFSKQDVESIFQQSNKGYPQLVMSLCHERYRQMSQGHDTANR